MLQSLCGLMAATLALLTTAYAAATPAVIASKLNLRAGPGPAFAVIVVMPVGATVDVRRCSDQWCRVQFGRHSGYASRLYLGAGTDSYASAAEPSPPAETAGKPTLTGPRVWRWRDREWRDRHWRQFGWRRRMKPH